MDHYFTLPRIISGSTPEHKALSRRLNQERIGWFIRNNYEKTDFDLPVTEFAKVAGESLLDSLQEDRTWLAYYRRFGDA